jgi:hypothetical protein
MPIGFQLRNMTAIVILTFMACSFAFAGGKEKDVGIWKPTGLMAPYESLAAVEVGPEGDLWAIIGYPEATASLIHSANGGTTWTTVTDEIAPFRTWEPPTYLVVDSQNCAWAYPPWGLSRYSAHGDLLTTTSLSRSAQGSPVPMVSSPDGYVYRAVVVAIDRISMNGEVRVTLPGFDSDTIYVLTVDSKGTLFAVGTYAFRSRDGGLTWETIFEGDHAVRYNGIAAAPDGTYYLWTSGRILRSTDGGKIWRRLPPLSEQQPLMEIHTLPDSSVVAAYGRNLSNEGGLWGFFRSWDRGNTWEDLMAGIPKADYLGCEHVVTYGDRIVYAYFRFVEGSSSQSGLYRMLLPQRAGAGKEWIKY